MLGALIALRDRVPPLLRLHARRLGPHCARVRVMGGGTWLVGRVDVVRGGKRVARDRRRPFLKVVRVGRGRVRLRARIVLLDGRRVVRTRRVGRARGGSTAH